MKVLLDIDDFSRVVRFDYCKVNTFMVFLKKFLSLDWVMFFTIPAMLMFGASVAVQTGALAQADRGVEARATVRSAQTLTLPVNTLIQVTPMQEITSKNMKEGTTRDFLVVDDVSYQGVVFIPRGSHVSAQVSWRTGKGIVGKSAKFELSFQLVRVDGAVYRLRGVHRQEGRGNTAGALLGAAIITGKSATMLPGQIVNVFTAEPIIKTKFYY